MYYFIVYDHQKDDVEIQACHSNKQFVDKKMDHYAKQYNKEYITSDVLDQQYEGTYVVSESDKIIIYQIVRSGYLWATYDIVKLQTGYIKEKSKQPNPMNLLDSIQSFKLDSLRKKGLPSKKERKGTGFSILDDLMQNQSFQNRIKAIQVKNETQKQI